MKNNTYYAQVMHWDDQENIEEFERIFNEDGEEALLGHAEMWDEACEHEIAWIGKTPYESSHDNIIAEDDDYMLTYYKGWPGESYSLLRKLTQEQFDEEDMRLDGKLTEMLNKNIR